jgi:hypothetical protein
MTLPDPTSDLRWSRLLEILVPIDVSDLVTRFRSAVADELDAQDGARQIQGAASAIELVSNLTRRYDNAIGWLADARIPHHPLHSCKKSTMIFLQEGRILHGDC